jgi:hypothetical protein
MALRLSDDQMAAFRAAGRARFLEEAARHLRDRFPQARDRPEAELAALLETAIARGRRYGVTSAYDVRRFAECLLLHGADFPEGPDHGWARGLLETEGLSGRRKMTALVTLEIGRGR